MHLFPRGKKVLSALACAGLALGAGSLQAQQSQNNILRFAGRYSSGSYGTATAETVSYDSASKRLFFSGAVAAKVTALNFADPTKPSFLFDIDLTPYGPGVNSVAVKNGIVAVAVEAAVKQNNGKVVFFTTGGQYLNQVTVGALPDMVTFSPDGKYVLTANEGEPNMEAIGATPVYGFDPEGSVSIINIANGVANATVANAGFSAFNNRRDSLRATGIRLYGANNASVAQDMEPEYISVSGDSRTAWVTLQENNAVAAIDLTTATVREIMPLGLKDHSKGLPRLQNFEFTDRNIIGTTPAGQQIKLGGFSGLWYEGVNQQNGNLKFITHGDRGPNGEPTTINGFTNARPFVLPNYQARLTRFELNRTSGAITVTQNIFLTRQDGITPLSGLPNLQAGAQGTAYTDEIPVDLFGNRLTNDPFGADLEGIVIDGSGNFWLCDEYRPAVYKFSPEGRLIRRFIPMGTAAAAGQAAGTYGTEIFPAAYAQRRANRGFEAIAIEGTKIYAFIQSPVDNPDVTNDANSNTSSMLRILELDMVSETVTGEYILPMFEAFNPVGNNRVDKIGDAVSLGGGRFMVMIRDSRTGSDAKKLVYEINLRGATNTFSNPPVLNSGETLDRLTYTQLLARGIRPVYQRKVLNIPSLGYTGGDKTEGLAMIDANTFAVINDNDFGLIPQPIAGNGSITLNPDDKIVLGLISFDRPNGIDASDQDGGINIRNWPVFGMFLPDAISQYSFSGQNYFITANEGDTRDYGSTFNEERRISDATNIRLDATAYPNAATLRQNANLGRLRATSSSGDIDGDGDIDEINVFGGRSFSIWDASGNLVFDSGSDFETRTAQLLPTGFNTSNDNNTFDSRSASKGPEPEAITIGTVGDSSYAFIGLERTGGIFVYNITNPWNVRYVDYINTRNLGVTPSQANIATVGDLGPEILSFIPGSQSPNGRAYIIAANEISGSVSVYEINAPQISSQPRSQSVCAGSGAEFRVTATGPDLRYQWQRDGVNIPGATSSILSLSDIKYAQGGTYRVVISSAQGIFSPVSSDAATLNIMPATQITRQPDSRYIVRPGQSLSIPIEANVSGNASYQWYRNGQPLAENGRVSGTRSSILGISVIQASDTAGIYTVSVFGPCGSLSSTAFRIIIPSAQISAGPAALSLCPGDSASFSVQAQTSTGGALRYQWHRNNIPLPDGSRISGAQSSRLVIRNISAADAGSYSVAVTPGEGGAEARSEAILTVNTPTVITQQPLTLDTCASANLKLSVTADGSSLSYSWTKDGTLIPGASASVLNVSAAGKYRVRVQGLCAAVESQEADVVLHFPPAFTVQPQPASLSEGGTISLNAELSETEGMSYQWLRDGQPIAGATAKSYTQGNVRMGDRGKYSLRATNRCGSAVSAEANIDIVSGVGENISAEGFSLSPAEPNPFTEEATIRFTTPAAAYLRIAVRDLLGTELAVIAEGRFDAGSYPVRISPQQLGLGSGVYYCTLSSGNVSLMRKIVIVK